MEANKNSKKLMFGRPKSVFDSETVFCPGCQHPTVMRIISEVIDELEIQGEVIGIGGVGCHFFTTLYMNVDFVQALHGRSPSVATGIKRASLLKTTPFDPIVFTVQGDGDLAAIGMGDIINAVVRGEKFTTFFFNNSGYGTTGGQMAPTTLIGQTTTTTPLGRTEEREGFPVHMAELLASFPGVVYSARCALNSHANYNRTKKAVKTAFKKQIDGVGFSIVEILSVCPSTLKKKPIDALKWFEDHMLKEYPLGVFKDAEKAAVEYKVA